MFRTLLSILLSVYFVSFTGKDGSTPIPFSERAQEQRSRWNIHTDSLDYAVSPLWLDSIQRLGGKIHHTSRWFNGATVEMDSQTAQRVAACRFVQSVGMTRDNTNANVYIHQRKQPQVSIDYGKAQEQINLYNLAPLHRAGFEGQGILMAVCDGGFYNADTASFLDNTHLLGYFDFTDDTYDFFGSAGEHGTECLSVIAGQTSDFCGSATQADYYLMRSEENDTESPKEMDNLVAALEKADSLGVNIFSVSLGYYEFDNARWNLSYTDMDGTTTRCSRAAAIAARKGMLVCVAAGNEGNKSWHYIDAPADADSILTVGAVTPQGSIASFSSRGPSRDGRTKPDVCAVGAGTCLLHPDRTAPFYGNGTSFACPLIAGMAASLWSAMPDENAMQIRERIIRSANRYNNPDSEYGYGIPDAWTAYTGTTGLQDTESTAKAHKVLVHNGIHIVMGGCIYDVLGRKIGNIP